MSFARLNTFTGETLSTDKRYVALNKQQKNLFRSVEVRGLVTLQAVAEVKYKQSSAVSQEDALTQSDRIQFSVY